MDVLILSDFCIKMDDPGNNRFEYLAKQLVNEHDVEILTSDFDHTKKSYFVKAPTNYPFKITMVHEGAYRRNVSMQRFLAHYIWSRNVKKYLQQRKKPDVIYAAVPPLTAPLAAAKYCEKNGVRFVIDIQDLWPEAFQMVFNVPLVSSVVFAPFRRLADGIYRRSDEICAVSKTYVDRALRVNKKSAEGHVVFLGTELATFDRNVAANPVEKPEGELWLGYCGTLGSSYDLTLVIDALAILKEKDVTPPKFMVFGDGERKAEFEQRTRDKGVDCLFTGRLPYDQMCGWLAVCDMVVNPIMHNAAQSIINKHADYAASGLPVLNTQENNEYRALVEEYQMGFNCKNGDPADLAEKLAILLKDQELRKAMGNNARRCAEDRFDRAHSYQKLIDAISND